MNALNLSLSFFLLTGMAFASDPAATTSPNSGDLLNEALPILLSKYIDGKTLQVRAGDQLTDVIARSDGKISLVTPDTILEPHPIVTVSLPDNILYWRLGSFTPEKNWLDLAAQLQQATPATAGIIIDLRSNSAPDDYAGAAQVMNFFVPGDRTFSKFRPQNVDGGGVIASHPFRAPIVVLTNNQTTGAAEALAACLKADGALVMGRATSGKAAIYGEQKLSSGQILRYVESDVLLANGDSLWNHPVTPDISLTVHDQTEKGALILIAHKGILDVIQEDPARHRMSEASLVQGDDPEWDDYLASLKKKPFLLSLPAIHDVVLISAIDSLKAIQLSQRHEIPSAGSSGQPSASASIQ